MSQLWDFLLLLMASLIRTWGYSKINLIAPSVVRALPLAAGINEGGNYFAYIIPFFLLTTAIQNHKRGCCRFPNFCMGVFRFLKSFL